jgi:hypothetical protein
MFSFPEYSEDVLCMKEWASAEFAYAEPSIFFTVSEDTGT